MRAFRNCRNCINLSSFFIDIRRYIYLQWHLFMSDSFSHFLHKFAPSRFWLEGSVHNGRPFAKQSLLRVKWKEVWPPTSSRRLQVSLTYVNIGGVVEGQHFRKAPISSLIAPYSESYPQQTKRFSTNVPTEGGWLVHPLAASLLIELELRGGKNEHVGRYETQRLVCT